MASRYLFLAMSGAAYGEATLARRIAIDLAARGDAVTVLSSRALAPLWANAPVRFGAIDDLWQDVETVVANVIAKQRCDRLVLVDLTATLVACALHGVDPKFVHRVGAPVVALDIWDLPSTSRRWDLGSDVLALGDLDIAVRLVPCPFAAPSTPGAYDALPEAVPAERGARTRILVTTAAWQSRTARGTAHAGIMQVVPERFVAELGSLGDDVEVVHVGPARLHASEQLGARYTWRERVPPDDMRALVAGADLVVTLNLASTTILTALASGVPVVVGINSHRGATASELAAVLPQFSEDARARLAPLHPFSVWPLGLHAFMQPVLAPPNPYLDVVRPAEILVPGALARACRDLLFDPGARAAAHDRITRYVATVRALPSAAAVLSSLS